MPFLRKRKSTTRPRRRLAVRRPVRRAGRMPRAPTGSFASRAETYELATTAGQSYDLNNIALGSALPACTALAKLYQYYRITSVQMRIKPNSDTYAPGTVALPYLYFLYDKSGALGTLSGPDFLACGAKPVRVDDKTIVRKWQPSVRISGDNAVVPMFRKSPWMPTASATGALNAVPHLGAVWYISKINNTDAQTYLIDITVTVQFKKPLVTPSQATPLEV